MHVFWTNTFWILISLCGLLMNKHLATWIVLFSDLRTCKCLSWKAWVLWTTLASLFRLLIDRNFKNWACLWTGLKLNTVPISNICSTLRPWCILTCQATGLECKGYRDSSTRSSNSNSSGTWTSATTSSVPRMAMIQKSLKIVYNQWHTHSKS